MSAAKEKEGQGKKKVEEDKWEGQGKRKGEEKREQPLLQVAESTWGL